MYTYLVAYSYQSSDRPRSETSYPTGSIIVRLNHPISPSDLDGIVQIIYSDLYQVWYNQDNIANVTILSWSLFGNND